MTKFIENSTTIHNTCLKTIRWQYQAGRSKEKMATQNTRQPKIPPTRLVVAL